MPEAMTALARPISGWARVPRERPRATTAPVRLETARDAGEDKGVFGGAGQTEIDSGVELEVFVDRIGDAGIEGHGVRAFAGGRGHFDIKTEFLGQAVTKGKRIHPRRCIGVVITIPYNIDLGHRAEIPIPPKACKRRERSGRLRHGGCRNRGSGSVL